MKNHLAMLTLMIMWSLVPLVENRTSREETLALRRSFGRELSVARRIRMAINLYRGRMNIEDRAYYDLKWKDGRIVQTTPDPRFTHISLQRYWEELRYNREWFIYVVFAIRYPYYYRRVAMRRYGDQRMRVSWQWEVTKKWGRKWRREHRVSWNWVEISRNIIRDNLPTIAGAVAAVILIQLGSPSLGEAAAFVPAMIPGKWCYCSQSDGDDGDDGLTEENAKATLSAVVGIAAQSDYVALKRGDTWTGEYIDSFTVTGTANAHTTITAYGAGADPIIDVNDTGHYGIRMEAAYITVDGIEIRNATYGIAADTTVTNNIVQNCTVRDTSATSIINGAGTGFYAYNDECDNGGNSGLGVIAPSEGYPTETIIEYCYSYGHSSNDGVSHHFSGGNDNIGPYHMIKDCTFENCPEEGGDIVSGTYIFHFRNAYTGNSFMAFGSGHYATDVDIAYCESWYDNTAGATSGCCAMLGGENTRMYNTLLVEGSEVDWKYGICISDEDAHCEPTGIYVMYNTVVADTGGYMIGIVNDNSNVGTVTIKNNVVQQLVGTQQTFMISWHKPFNDSDYDIDYNQYYNVSSFLNRFCYYDGTAYYYNWSQWQALGNDTHGKVTDPDLVDPTGSTYGDKRDFYRNSAKDDAVAISTGTWYPQDASDWNDGETGLNEDQKGAARTGGGDAGFDEYGGAPPPEPDPNTLYIRSGTVFKLNDGCDISAMDLMVLSGGAFRSKDNTDDGTIGDYINNGTMGHSGHTGTITSGEGSGCGEYLGGYAALKPAGCHEGAPDVINEEDVINEDDVINRDDVINDDVIG